MIIIQFNWTMPQSLTFVYMNCGFQFTMNIQFCKEVLGKLYNKLHQG